MTRAEMAKLINDIGFPWAYYSFENSVAPDYPFVIYYYTSNADKIADNTNYCKIDTVVIEFYSQQVDFTNEEAIETALNAAGIVYSKERTYIATELAWQTTYESEVIITNGQ